MTSDFEKYEQIDAFLSGKLTGSELQDFQAQMASNPAFKVEVASQKAANAVIMDSGLLELRHKMNAFRPTPKSTPRIAQLFIVAMGVVLLSGVSVWFLSNEKENTNPVISANDLNDNPEISTSEEVIIVTEEEVVFESDLNEIEEAPINEEPVAISAPIEDETTIEAEISPAVISDTEIETNSTAPTEIEETSTPKHNCRPTSLFPNVQFDEYYKYVDVEISNFGSLEPPYSYFVNDKPVKDFKKLSLVDMELKVTDKHGCSGRTILGDFHAVDDPVAE